MSPSPRISVAEQIETRVSDLEHSVAEQSQHLIETLPTEELTAIQRLCADTQHRAERMRHQRSRLENVGLTGYLKEEASRAYHGVFGYQGRFPEGRQGAKQAYESAKADVVAMHFYDQHGELVDELLDHSRAELKERRQPIEPAEPAEQLPDTDSEMAEFQAKQVTRRLQSLRPTIQKQLPREFLPGFKPDSPVEVAFWYDYSIQHDARERRRLGKPTETPPTQRRLQAFWNAVDEPVIPETEWRAEGLDRVLTRIGESARARGLDELKVEVAKERFIKHLERVMDPALPPHQEAYFRHRTGNQAA
jgi:hypothetical protein